MPFMSLIGVGARSVRSESLATAVTDKKEHFCLKFNLKGDWLKEASAAGTSSTLARALTCTNIATLRDWLLHQSAVLHSSSNTWVNSAAGSPTSLEL
jgi:hypothetical protein